MINTKVSFQASILATAILLTACGGDSKSSNKDNTQIGFSSQVGSNSIISALGGNSASQQGGQGGSVTISQTNSPAPLQVLTSGSPDTSYQLPATQIQLGTLAVTLSEDTEVEVITRLSNKIEVGTLYLVANKNRLYQYDGKSEFAARNNEVTGLVINADTILTLDANSGDNIALLFANDLVNNGTIESTVSDNQWNANSQRASISLNPSAYSGTGNIKTHGAYPSQEGGHIRISASNIINSGNFYAQGEDGESSGDTEGGRGGNITLNAYTFIENQGDLNTAGGHSEIDMAGSAGSVSFNASEIYNSGKISAVSGEGQNASKPASNQRIELLAQEVLINSGDLNVNGGDAINNGYATNAGNIYLTLDPYNWSTRSQDRRLINNANLSANGGNTETTNSDQNAGHGGYIEVSVTESPYYPNQVAADSLVIIAGNLLANGGDSKQEFVENGNADIQGSSAGHAGSIWIEHNSTPSHTLPTYLAGYRTITVDGGEGIQAGDAGDVDISNRKNSSAAEDLAGPITIEVDIKADGGISILSDSPSIPSAGNGGLIGIGIMQDQAYLQAATLSIKLTGDVSANAGDVDNGYKGYAQGIFISAPHSLTASADLSANGSSDTEAVDTDDTFNQGSAGGDIWLHSFAGSINFSGSVSANGGNGLLKGGDAGYFTSTSSTSNRVAGNIALNGGNAYVENEDNPALDAGIDEATQGGDAGIAYITSSDFSATLSASITTRAGTGTAAGRDGGAFVNADCQIGSCNDQADSPNFY